MAKKGGSNILKRHNAPKATNIPHKEARFAIKSSPGPHSKESSVAIGHILRDLLKVSSTLQEAKRILNQRKVKINGTVRKNHQFPAGLFDIVSVEGLESDYRLEYDYRGRLVPEKTEKKEKIIKPAKVSGKKFLKGGKLQLTTECGRNIVTEEKEVKVNDTIMLELPKQKIEKIAKLKTGAEVYITGGAHTASKAKIIKIIPGNEKSLGRVLLKNKKGEFETTLNHVIVIGE